MSDVLALFRIQELELDIIDRTRRIKSINTQLEDDAALEEAQRHFDEAQEAFEAVAKQTKEVEVEIAAVTEKRADAETRLYSGEVKNPKELREMQMEVEALGRRKSVLEDEIQRLSAVRDDLLQKSTDSEVALKGLKKSLRVENQQLVSERDSLASSVNKLLKERKTGLEEISPDLIKRYNKMRKPKAHRPIAELRDNACTICGIEQNSMVIAAMHRADDVVTCQHCGRMLIRI